MCVCVSKAGNYSRLITEERKELRLMVGFSACLISVRLIGPESIFLSQIFWATSALSRVELSRLLVVFGSSHVWKGPCVEEHIRRRPVWENQSNPSIRQRTIFVPRQRPRSQTTPSGVFCRQDSILLVCPSQACTMTFSELSSPKLAAAATAVPLLLSPHSVHGGQAGVRERRGIYGERETYRKALEARLAVARDQGLA